MPDSSVTSRNKLAKVVGYQIRAFRRERNLGQDELAVMLKLPTSAIALYEEGRGLPRAYTLYRLGHIFGVSVDSLFGKGDASEQPLTDTLLLSLFRECQSLAFPDRRALTGFLWTVLEGFRKLGR